MTTVGGVPLPTPAAERTAEVAFSTENAFWGALFCSFGPVRHQRVARPTARAVALLSVGLELRVPDETTLIWARYEITVSGTSCIDVFPRLVTEPSVALGPLSVDDEGRLTRMVNAHPEGNLQPQLSGWVDVDGTAVWDLVPVYPRQLWSLPFLLSAVCPEPECPEPDVFATDHRLVAALVHPVVGLRLAVFALSSASMEGDPVAYSTAPGEGLLESALVVDAAERAGAVRTRLAETGLELVVVTSRDGILALLTDKQVRALVEDAGLVDPNVPPPPHLDADRPVHEAAAAVKEQLARGLRPVGAVLTTAGRPIGVLSAATALDLVGAISRSGDQVLGAPLSGLVFVCQAHDERMSVAYFDPDDPPRCSQGDLMRRQRS